MKNQGASIKFKRIGWMMIVSQLTLLLFTYIWISHQYQLSRSRMQRDLQNVFHKTQTRLTDNILNKLVDSLLVTQLGADIMNPSSDKQKNSTLHVDPMIQLHPDSIRKNSDTVQVIGMHIYQAGGDSLLSAREAIKMMPPDEELQVKNVLRGTLKQVLVNKELNHQVSISKVDSNLLLKEFDHAVKEIYPLLQLKWADTYGDSGFSFKPEATIKAYIFAYNYQRYNFINILPQIAFIIFLLSITALSFGSAYKNMKRQALFAEQKNTFISNISHELKTPVATTKVALEALSTYHGLEDQARTKRYLKIAEWEMNRLAALINRVLHTIQTENGMIRLELEKVDIIGLFKEVITTLSPSIAEKNIEIEYDHLPDELCINVDALHLNGILYNLLDNAIKYGKGLIKISVWEKEKNVFISIANNGHLISDEYKSKIFEKFFRIPNENNYAVKGHGLGLSYALYIAKAHGGNLLLERDAALNNFIVTLPKI